MSSAFNEASANMAKWPLKRLEDIVASDAPIVYGILQAGPHRENGIPYVRPTEIQGNEIQVSQLLRTSPEIAARYRRSQLRANDIILSIVGSIGKVAVVPHELEGGNLNQSAVRIRTNREVMTPEFLSWFLRSPLATIQYKRWMFGSAVMRLNVGHVRNLLVPVPPIAVQKDIVGRLASMITRVDVGVQSIRNVGMLVERYRISVFNSACRGELVPNEALKAKKQGIGYVSSLETVSATAQPPFPNRWKSRSQNIIPGHAALAVGNPETSLPEGWSWVPLVRIAKMESGHTPSRTNPSWWAGDIPWLSLVDARKFNQKTISETEQHISTDGLANSAARLLPAGTVCVSRTAAVGNVVILGRSMATSQDFVNWVPTPAVTSFWLSIVFSADRHAFRRFGRGSIHTTVYFPELMSLHIALPPKAEQIRIAEEVERRLTVAERLKLTIDNAVAQADVLRSAILSQEFPMYSELQSVNRENLESLEAPDNAVPTSHLRDMVMPPKRAQKLQKTKPILDVIRSSPDGITVEDLFAETGYFAASDPDGFYQELVQARDEIEEVRLEASDSWPSQTSIRLRLREIKL